MCNAIDNVRATKVTRAPHAYASNIIVFTMIDFSLLSARGQPRHDEQSRAQMEMVAVLRCLQRKYFHADTGSCAVEH